MTGKSKIDLRVRAADLSKRPWTTSTCGACRSVTYRSPVVRSSDGARRGRADRHPDAAGHVPGDVGLRAAHAPAHRRHVGALALAAAVRGQHAPPAVDPARARPRAHAPGRRRDLAAQRLHLLRLRPRLRARADLSARPRAPVPRRRPHPRRVARPAVARAGQAAARRAAGGRAARRDDVGGAHPRARCGSDPAGRRRRGPDRPPGPHARPDEPHRRGRRDRAGRGAEPDQQGPGPQATLRTAARGHRLTSTVVIAVPDPTVLYRVRDGVYAGDLLIAAVAELDLFTWLAANG